MLALGCMGSTAAPDISPHPQAEFAAGPALPAASAWQAVALPHDWRAHGVPAPGDGHYRFTLDLPAAQAGQAWALWSARLPQHHRLRLNGGLVADTWDNPSLATTRTAPLLIALPPAMLQAGAVQLEIDERGGRRAGLGTVYIGPEALVRQQANAWRRLYIELPRLLNGAAAGTALFALLLWWLRRQETLIGLYGVLSLLLSFRNFVYFEPALGNNGGVGMFVANCLVCLLYAHFGFVATGRASRVSRWACGTVALVCAAGVAWAWGRPEGMHQVRLLVYPLLMLPAGAATLLLLRRAARLPRRSVWWLAGAGGVLFGSGVHDYLLEAGRLPFTHEFILVWTAPLLAIAYSLALGRRLVEALHEAETGRLVLEARVAERTTLLTEANAAKSRFLAAASHDLRQPLASIGLLMGLLRDQISAPAQQRLVDRVDASLGAMESLLRGLLDLSRLESGSTPVQAQAIPLRPLLAALQAQARTAADHQGLQLRLRAPASAVAWADRLLLEQIVRNLLGNALRYTAAGGVLMAVRRHGGHWRLQVWDTGPGIPVAQQVQVFEAFVQGDNPHRDRQQGLGLGLAIVQRAAGLLGSTVRLQSRPGRGSCFSIDLPMAASSLPTPAPETAPAADEHTPTSLGRQTIPWLQGQPAWLVEDDDAVREALADSLAAWGADVTALRTPADLPELLASARRSGHRPALLLTDLRLPGGDGLTLAREVHAALGPVPTLVITGNTAPQDMQALAASGLPVLHKPFLSSQLRAVLVALHA